MQSQESTRRHASGARTDASSTRHWKERQPRPSSSNRQTAAACTDVQRRGCCTEKWEEDNDNMLKCNTFFFLHPYLIKNVIARSLCSQFDQMCQTLSSLLQLVLPLFNGLKTDTLITLSVVSTQDTDHHCMLD